MLQKLCLVAGGVLLVLLLLLVFRPISGDDRLQVVVYTALDEDFSRPVFWEQPRLL